MHAWLVETSPGPAAPKERGHGSAVGSCAQAGGVDLARDDTDLLGRDTPPGSQ